MGLLERLLEKKNMLSKQEVFQVLKEKEEEWKFAFLKDFKANLTLTPDAFERMCNEFLQTVSIVAKRLPPPENFKSFIGSIISEEELLKQPKYSQTYNIMVKKLESQPPPSAAPAGGAGQPGTPQQVVEIPVKIKETIVRKKSKFTSLESESMTVLLKKTFGDVVTNLVHKINPALAKKLQGNKMFYDFRTFFQFLNKVMKPEWIDNDQFFQHDWRQFAEVAKQMYLKMNAGTRVSSIRTGMDIKDFTRANFYGMILTADYCADELRNPKIGFNFNSCIRFFTLSFERHPDEVLTEAKFINLPYTVEIFKSIFHKILNNDSSVAAAFLGALNKKVTFSKILNAGDDVVTKLFVVIKKIYYLSLIYNYCVTLCGTKTMTGWLSPKNEPLTFYHPTIINEFKKVISEEEWDFEKEISEMALEVNMFKGAGARPDDWLIPNLIRGITESIKVEIPLLNTTSLVTSKQVKQGMERELSTGKYFEPVQKILIENINNVKNILQKIKRG